MLAKVQCRVFWNFPYNASEFAGTLKEAFALIPEWQSGVTYPKDVQECKKVGTRYTSDIVDNTSTPPTNWTEVEFTAA